jgi:hypothetical protein
MAKDELTYSEAVRTAAAEAGAALGTFAEAVQATPASALRGRIDVPAIATRPAFCSLKGISRRLANGQTCSRPTPK